MKTIELTQLQLDVLTGIAGLIHSGSPFRDIYDVLLQQGGVDHNADHEEVDTELRFPRLTARILEAQANDGVQEARKLIAAPGAMSGADLEFAKAALSAFLDNEGDQGATDGIGFIIAESLLRQAEAAGDGSCFASLPEMERAILNYCIKQERNAESDREAEAESDRE